MSKTFKGYIVRSTVNPKYIFCTNRVFEHENYVGVGTSKSVKIYKTRAGASKVRNGDSITIEEYFE